MKLEDRFTGSLVGLAVGDALGASVEFLERGSYEEIREYRSGGKLNVSLGEYTDDTAMSLCLVQSLIEDGFDEASQLEYYAKWYKNAYMSADNRVVGVGKTVQRSIMRHMGHKDTVSKYKNTKKDAGNGSLMRITPIALFNHKNIKKALSQSALSSYTTHGLDVCADACMMYAGLIVGVLQGLGKSEVLSDKFADYLFSLAQEYDISKDVKSILKGSYKEKSRDEIYSTGYVIYSLESALWCFYNSSTFEEGLIKAVNLGNDTDTIGAIYGQLAGAYYGYEAIPKHLREHLMRHDFIKNLALKLHEVST